MLGSEPSARVTPEMHNYDDLSSVFGAQKYSRKMKSASMWSFVAHRNLSILSIRRRRIRTSVLSCVSFTTSGWASGKDYTSGTTTYYGLWRVCTGTNLVQPCQSLDGTATDWYVAVQTLVVFGFFGTVLSFMLVTLFMFINYCKTNGELGLGAAIICIVTGILYLIGCIVFGTQWDKYYPDTPTTNFSLEYGFVLSVIALALELLSGIFLFAETRRVTSGSPWLC